MTFVKKETVMLNQVVMILMLVSSNGSVASGVLPFRSYDECYQSLNRPINSQHYVYSDRICMNAALFDLLKGTN